MPEENDEWTGEFVARALRKHTEVKDVKLLAPKILEIVRKKYTSFQVGTVASAQVKPSSIQQLLNDDFEIEFIVNVPKESFWTGTAIQVVSSHSVAFGGVGDLFAVISLPDVRKYINKEFEFVERGLRHHTRVKEFERVHDRLYVVRRQGLADVTVVLLNEYELTADHVRTAHDRYGYFSSILITNPNGRPTSSAGQAAESMGVQIYKWGEFLGRLNKK